MAQPHLENEDDIDDRLAWEATEAFLAAHPAHAMTIKACSWMGSGDGVDYFKHRLSRRNVTFDRRTLEVGGYLDTGEESDDADMVLRHLPVV